MLYPELTFLSRRVVGVSKYSQYCSFFRFNQLRRCRYVNDCSAIWNY